MYVHTLNTPKVFSYIINIIKKYQRYDNLWMCSLKNIYTLLVQQNLYLSRIQVNYQHVNWPMIWKSVWSFSSNIERTILYRYIYSVAPVGEYFVRYGITNKIPKCLMCNSGVFTEKHIFQKCLFFQDQRQKFGNTIRIKLLMRYFLNLGIMLNEIIKLTFK